MASRMFAAAFLRPMPVTPNLDAARLPGFIAEKLHLLLDGKTDEQIDRRFDQPAHRTIPVVMKRHDWLSFYRRKAFFPNPIKRHRRLHVPQTILRDLARPSLRHHTTDVHSSHAMTLG